MFCSEVDCKKCSNYLNCELRLPYSKGLKKTQNQIITILKQLKEVEEDITYLKRNNENCIYLFNHPILTEIIIERKRKNWKQVKEKSRQYNELSLHYLQNKKQELTTELRQLRKLEYKKIKLLKKLMEE